MQNLFPPGDTTWRNSRPRSLWREFAYLFHQTQRAIEPFLPLQEALDDWNPIAQALAESPRKRVAQVAKFFKRQ